MKAEVYVIAGILDSGKTTWINHMLSQASDKGKEQQLVIQLEEGDAAIHLGGLSTELIQIPIHEFTTHISEWEKRLYDCITGNKIKTVYLECNGILPFEKVEELFFRGLLSKVCKIKHVFYLVRAGEVLPAIKGMGAGPVSQMRNADSILYLGELKKDEKELIKQVNPDATLISNKQAMRDYNKIIGEGSSPYMGLAIVTTLLFVSGLLYPIFQLTDSRVGETVSIFVGLMLQGIPFLLIGVLLSSFIQVFISRETILKWFPKKRWSGLLVAVLAGFCLPVCDCASIPIFKSLVRKGVPLYVAVTFMFAAPVINPVVMLSTFYAFDGQLQVVAIRVLLGILAAVGIGVLISLVTKGEEVCKSTLGYAGCSCGCEEPMGTKETVAAKFRRFVRHSELEFLDVGRYLLLGTFISALFQVIQSDHMVCVCEWPFVLRLLLMMVLAFLLSLCSSADAVVARGFAQEFSLAAVMGFLVFGPMLDIKNVLMLQSGFHKKFIGKLCVIAFATCFIVVLAAAMIWKGGW